MKFRINPHLSSSSPPALPDRWSYIRQPGSRQSLWLSIGMGLAILVVMFVMLTAQARLRGSDGSTEDSSAAFPVWGLLPVIAASVVIHEGLHLLGHPGAGLTERSLVLLWPRQLGLGVFYDGFMPRWRWLGMRLAPLLGLVALPVLLLVLFAPWQMDFYLRQFLSLVALVNCVGSGGDLLAAIIVARQVPGDGEIGVWYGRACWRGRSAIG